MSGDRGKLNEEDRAAILCFSFTAHRSSFIV
jgi:hypothetical protein